MTTWTHDRITFSGLVEYSTYKYYSSFNKQLSITGLHSSQEVTLKREGRKWMKPADEKMQEKSPTETYRIVHYKVYRTFDASWHLESKDVAMVTAHALSCCRLISILVAGACFPKVPATLWAVT